MSANGGQAITTSDGKCSSPLGGPQRGKKWGTVTFPAPRVEGVATGAVLHEYAQWENEPWFIGGVLQEKKQNEAVASGLYVFCGGKYNLLVCTNTG